MEADVSSLHSTIIYSFIVETIPCSENNDCLFHDVEIKMADTQLLLLLDYFATELRIRREKTAHLPNIHHGDSRI